MQLSGRWIPISGAESGIGLTTARVLARECVHVGRVIFDESLRAAPTFDEQCFRIDGDPALQMPSAGAS